MVSTAPFLRQDTQPLLSSTFVLTTTDTNISTSCLPPNGPNMISKMMMSAMVLLIPCTSAWEFEPAVLASISDDFEGSYDFQGSYDFGGSSLQVRGSRSLPRGRRTQTKRNAASI